MCLQVFMNVLGVAFQALVSNSYIGDRFVCRGQRSSTKHINTVCILVSELRLRMKANQIIIMGYLWRENKCPQLIPFVRDKYLNRHGMNYIVYVSPNRK